MLSYYPGAPCHPGQGSTISHLCALREPCIGAIGVQTDGQPLAIKAANSTETILGVSDHRSAFEPDGASPPIVLPLAARRGLQAVELAAVQSGGNQIPQPGASRTACPADAGRQHPTIYG